MVPPGESGRRFTVRRRVRLGDATPNGRMRLDAMARFLQDVANDDSRSAGWSDPDWWVVRRTVLDVAAFPVYLQDVDVITWCGGVGSHWAERRTRLCAVDGSVLVDAAALWVHVDASTLQPSRVPDDVAEVLEESSQGRRIGARLVLKPTLFPADGWTDSPWPLRFTDYDAVGHMNNAAYWEPVEEVLAGERGIRAPMRAVIEHLVQIEPGSTVVRRVAVGEREASLNMMVGDTVHAAAWCGSAATA